MPAVYVNRAVSHLLWPGWESSGGPGSLWVPGLHVIHSWLGDRGGKFKSAQIQTVKTGRGEMEQRKAGRKENMVVVSV